jgi:hypothetical protein
MTSRPQWRSTLVEVEHSIEECLASLDRYEAAFARLLGNDQGNRTPDETSHEWDAKLAVATETTDEVEQLLAEQDGVWQRWRETLSSWNGLIEQPA